MEEHAFITETIYQIRMENKVERNTPLMMHINTKIQVVDNVNVMQTSVSKIRCNRQPILLPKEHVWSRFSQSTYEQHRLTTT